VAGSRLIDSETSDWLQTSILSPSSDSLSSLVSSNLLAPKNDYSVLAVLCSLIT